ncbi:MAG: hypothetical protein A2070_00880 [Bdellovibrionales bacterium GWC1_52_8]|nr:MAG: hypothetical protein A2X97_11460 [Bdellovibrionales bacterium GWA1_52_35]OFZ38418.1 MAG: hypothetical protein A2070_00880 [Bdellovibrionales bacterium GWC1_52_8]HCM39149.1 hypothetical protein [Bdellovibrionales bacterium]
MKLMISALLGSLLATSTLALETPEDFFRARTDRSLLQREVYDPFIIPVAPDPEVAARVAQVDTQLLRATVLKLTSATDRRAGSSENQALTLWAHDQLKALGYQTSLQCYRPDQCNVIAEKAGIISAGPDGPDAVVIAAHLDSVGRPNAGADDNASGVAGLLEMARIFAPLSAEKSVRFLVTNSEENGMVGAQYYLNSLAPAAIKRLKWVLVLDMIGFNSNGQLDLETDEKFRSEAEWLAGKAATYSSLRGRVSTPAWGSDHVPFLRKYVPTLLAIEDWDTHTPCYHQACDTEATVNYAYAAEIVKLSLAGLFEKAGTFGMVYVGR